MTIQNVIFSLFLALFPRTLSRVKPLSITTVTISIPWYDLVFNR
jgi:hypothetical protein